MGSVSGLTAFALVFLSLAMLMFWSVTDIGGNEVVQQQLLKFQAKEIANNVEIVSEYENEGFAEISLGENYTFGITAAGPSSPAPYLLVLELAGNKRIVDLNVDDLEDQNQPGASMANFTTNVVCVYRDYDNNDYFYYLGVSSIVGTNPEDTYLGDIYDPEDSNPGDGSVETDDPYVQIYPGECL